MKPNPAQNERRGEWTAQTDTPQRSVFGNYRGQAEPRSEPASLAEPHRPVAMGSGARRQTAVGLAMARAFIYRFLAQAYADPTREGWQWLCLAETNDALRAAAHALPALSPGQALERSMQSLSAALDPAAAAEDSFHAAFVAAFGHAARGSCPLNEIEYGDLKADPLIQPHRLADLAAFYRAFGLERADDAGERHDHIGLELEFLCVLAAQEAYALEHQLAAEQLEQCRHAQKDFLREHLGRWTPGFARRLAAATSEPALRALAEFTRAFVEYECGSFGVSAGSPDFMLRPVDEAAESLCAACGITHPLPGVIPTP